MRDYELTVLARSDDTKGIKDLLSKSGAQINLKNDTVKKALAYEIDGVREAYYSFFEIELDPASVVGLDGKLRLMEDIVRYLLVRKGESQVAKVVKKTRKSK